MRQTFHIFRKDIRYLRYELLLVLALEVVFAILATRHPNADPVQILLPLAAGYMIVRLIHAEPIPGHTQFWITRPYRWRSLIAAKLIFILVFVQLPIFVVQLLILIVEGFPLGHSLPGLLWTQVLLIFAVWLPIAALAAMTSGIVPFLFTVLILMAIGIALQEMMFFSKTLHQWRQLMAQWPESVDWVHAEIIESAVVIIAVAVLYMQYRGRRTVLSRSSALGVAAFALAAYILAPWQLGMAVQSRLSKQPSAGSSVQVAPGVKPKRQILFRSGDYGNVYLPIGVKGIPAGEDIRADALAATIEMADGRTWKSGITSVNSRAISESANFEGTIPVDRALYDRVRQQTVTIHVTLYFTLFGNARSQTVPLRRIPVNVMDGLQCYLYPNDIFDHVYCRSAFRWPNRMVYVSNGLLNPVYQLISYSPFPSGISMDDAIESHWADGPPSSATQVTIVVKEPLAHLRRDLEFRTVRLVDFASP